MVKAGYLCATSKYLGLGYSASSCFAAARMDPDCFLWHATSQQAYGHVSLGSSGRCRCSMVDDCSSGHIADAQHTYDIASCTAQGGWPPSAPAPLNPPLCHVLMDMVIVIDKSGSMNDVHHAVEDFGADLVREFVLGSDGGAIAIVTFSDSANVISSLSTEEFTLVSALHQSSAPHGGTNMNAGMQAGVTLLDQSSRLNLPNLERIMVLITDGVQNSGFGGDSAAIETAASVKGQGISARAHHISPLYPLMPYSRGSLVALTSQHCSRPAFQVHSSRP